MLAAFPEEKPTRARVTGLLIGFAGILVVLGIWRGVGAGEWTGVLACLGAIACYGVAFPYSRRYLVGVPERPVALATGQVSLAVLLMAPALVITGVAPQGDVTAGIAAGMLALGAHLRDRLHLELSGHSSSRSNHRQQRHLPHSAGRCPGRCQLARRELDLEPARRRRRRPSRRRHRPRPTTVPALLSLSRALPHGHRRTRVLSSLHP